MSNYTTGVQRHNNRMDKIYNNAIELKQKYCEHKYTLVCDSISMQKFHRECVTCGKKAKTTNYKITL